MGSPSGAEVIPGRERAQPPEPGDAGEVLFPLENGDQLTRPEFERRYDAMPGLRKAELVQGVVYMPSAVSHRHHGNPHFNLIFWMGTYAAATPGVEGGDNTSLRLDLDNEPQPDAHLIVLPAYGGRVRIDQDGFIVGGPEVIGEVAASSASYDLHAKLNVYRRGGVQEYVVWRVLEKAIDWFVLRGGNYDRLAVAPSGFTKARSFPAFG